MGVDIGPAGPPVRSATRIIPIEIRAPCTMHTAAVSRVLLKFLGIFQPAFSLAPLVSAVAPEAVPLSSPFELSVVEFASCARIFTGTSLCCLRGAQLFEYDGFERGADVLRMASEALFCNSGGMAWSAACLGEASERSGFEGMPIFDISEELFSPILGGSRWWVPSTLRSAIDMDLRSLASPGSAASVLPGWSVVSDRSVFGRTQEQVVSRHGHFRGLLPLELERLRGFSDGFTAAVRSLQQFSGVPLDEVHMCRVRLLASAPSVFILRWLTVTTRPSTLALCLDATLVQRLHQPVVCPSPIWLLPPFCDTVARLRKACIFQQLVQCHHHAGELSQGPDWAEQNLHRALFAADGVQSRQAAGAAPLLPPLLPAELHAMCAAAHPCRLHEVPLLPRDLRFSLLVSSGSSPGVPLRNVAKWRTSQLRKLKRLVSEGERAGLRDYFEAHRSSTSRAIAAHQEPARVALTMASLSWPDLGLPVLSMAGSSLLGQMPCSGIFRPANVESSVSLHELLRTAGDFVSSVQTLPAPPPEQSKIIWENTRAEVAAGLMTQPCTREEMDRVFGAGRWRPIVRFALCQASGK